MSPLVASENDQVQADRDAQVVDGQGQQGFSQGQVDRPQLLGLIGPA